MYLLGSQFTNTRRTEERRRTEELKNRRVEGVALKNRRRGEEMRMLGVVDLEMVETWRSSEKKRMCLMLVILTW